MRKYISICLSIFILAGLAIGTALWVPAFYASIENYQSPLQQTELSAQGPALAKTANVVLVLVGGLGYDSWQTLDLPISQQLAQAGATAAMQSLPPTYSQIAQGTLVTGAQPELNGASPIDKPLEELSLLKLDTIFARAHIAQQKTAILGPASWRRLIPRNYLSETFFVNSAGPDADRAIVDRALPILSNSDIDLVFIHLTQLDFAAKHQGGTDGNAYLQAANNIESHLRQISQAIDTRETVLMILGDHGYTASGGHGGPEVEIVWQPFIMIGDSVTSGSYSDIHQVDVAPTITTILGTAPPTAAQGRILFEMLRLSERAQAVTQINLSQQRALLAEAYVNVLSPEPVPLPPALIADLGQAQDAFSQNNVRGAFQLALLNQEVADTQIALTRYAQLQAERWPRLIAVIAAILVWFTVMWHQRGEHIGLIIVAAVVTISLYHILFQLQGHTYSITTLTNFSELPLDIARRTAVSLLAGGGLILVLLMLVNEENWVVLLETGYGLSMLVTFVFALPLFWAFWQNGLLIDWHLPNVTSVFWQITGAFEILIAATLGLLLPWPIMLLNLFVNLARHFLDESPSRPEPDALSGLHL